MTILPRPQGGPLDIFEPDMLSGETQELFSKRMKIAAPGLLQKTYAFQIRNDDGRDHFREVSRRYPELTFVLTFDDGGNGQFGSYLIRDGRSKRYIVPGKVIDSVMAKHGFDPDSDDDDSLWLYWDASWELMDRAESHWLTRVVEGFRQ